MRQFFQKKIAGLLIEASGATAIEYALIAAGIAAVIITAVNGVGTAVNGMFTSVSSSLK